MSDTKMLLPETRAEQLIHEINAEVAAEVMAITDTAERSARQVVAQAYAAARLQLHDLVENLRREGQHRRDLARRQADAGATKQQQARALALLAEALPQLADALAGRWHDPAARGQWVAAAARVARDRLATSQWSLERPADWTPSDSREFRAALGPAAVTIEEADGRGLTTGLRVRAGDAVVDATPNGLAADAKGIMALLLAELARVPATGREDAR